MFATGDVLEVTAVALDTPELQARGDVHAFSDRQRFGRPTTPFEPRPTSTSQRYGQRALGGDGGRFELVDAVAVIDRDDEVALCGERRGTLAEWRPTSGDVSRPRSWTDSLRS